MAEELASKGPLHLAHTGNLTLEPGQKMFKLG